MVGLSDRRKKKQNLEIEGRGKVATRSDCDLQKDVRTESVPRSWAALTAVKWLLYPIESMMITSAGIP